MPYRTESYIDAEDNRRYIYFVQAGQVLQSYYDSILRLKSSYYPFSSKCKNSKGSYADKYEANAERLEKLLQSAVNEYDTFLKDLKACIAAAKSLAEQYERSRHRTRQVFYEYVGGH